MQKMGGRENKREGTRVDEKRGKRGEKVGMGSRWMLRLGEGGLTERQQDRRGDVGGGSGTE